MKMQYDLEQLRKRIGLIEHDLDDARRRLSQLELRQAVDESASVAPTPPPSEKARRVSDDEARWERVETVPARAAALPPALPEPMPERVFPVVAPGREAEERPVPAVETPPEWKTWLQRLQLWPPEDGESKEVRLGAWWATRLGTLLAVIGVVFFGVYVSLDTPHWVKFIELLAICAGVAVFGLWLERRIARFGAVMFAGGLALLYFCAFAGYALPAVRVLTSPAAAMGWQLAAVALIAAASVGRRSPGIATMAVGLGGVTAVFSRSGGLHEFALVAAAFLAVAAVGFHRRLRWEAPSVVAMPGSYAIYALVLQGNWLSGEAHSTVWPWVFLGGITTLFFVRDWRVVRVKPAEVGAGETWFQGTNSSLALLLGAVTALTLYRADMAWFYFGAAALLGIFTALRRAQVDGDAIGAVLLAKAAGMFTLGVITVVDARTTALALLVQAWVMLFCARRLNSRVLAAGMLPVAMAATFYFFNDNAGAMQLGSWRAAGALAFILGIAWLAAEARSRLWDKPDIGGMAWEVAGALVAVAGTVASVFRVQPHGWEPALLMGMAAVLGLPSGWKLKLGPLTAAALLAAGAHGGLWQLAESAAGPGRLLANTLAVLAPSVALGVWFGAKTRAGRGGATHGQPDLIGAGVCAITLLGLAHVLFVLTAPMTALGILILLALGLGALSPVWPGRHLPWLATWTSMAAVVFWQRAGADPASAGWLVVAFAAVWALPVGFHASGRHRAELKSEPETGWLVVAQMAAALLVTLKTLPFFLSGSACLTGYAFAALLVFGLTYRPGIAVALESSWVLWAALLWTMGRAMTTRTYGFTADSPWLAGVALAAWIPAVLLSLGAKNATELDNDFWWRRKAAGLQTLLATVIALWVCLRGFRNADLLVALVAAAGGAVAMLRVGRVQAARHSATVFVLFALGAAFGEVAAGRAEGWGDGLMAVLLVAGTQLVLPLVTAGDSRTKTNRLRWAGGVAGLVLAFYAARAQHGALAPYVTVGWGLASIVVFMTGLFTRTRPYRMLGLLGLAVCVPRMFMVDLDSALHRIAAFVVLGLVLLWVGFSYHRFRHLITDAPEEKLP